MNFSYAFDIYDRINMHFWTKYGQKHSSHENFSFEQKFNEMLKVLQSELFFLIFCN